MLTRLRIWWLARKVRRGDLLALRSLFALDDVRVVRPLLAAVNEPLAPDVAARITAVLGNMFVPGVKEELLRALSEERGPARLTCAAALANHSLTWDQAAPLAAMLQDGSSDARLVAVRALKDIRDPRAVETLAMLLSDDSPTVRLAAVSALGRIDGDGAVAALQPLLGDADADVRLQVLQALGSRLPADTIILRLSDPDRRVRNEAASVLRKAASPQVRDWVARALNDVAPFVRWVAVRSIDDGFPVANAKLTALLGDPEWLVAAAAWTKLLERSWRPTSLDHEMQLNRIALGDPEMVESLTRLCEAYRSNDQRQIDALEPIASQIGEMLDATGGLQEMRRVYDRVPDQQGKRTLAMHWGGIGDWTD